MSLGSPTICQQLHSRELTGRRAWWLQRLQLLRLLLLLLTLLLLLHLLLLLLSAVLEKVADPPRTLQLVAASMMLPAGCQRAARTPFPLQPDQPTSQLTDMITDMITDMMQKERKVAAWAVWQLPFPWKGNTTTTGYLLPASHALLLILSTFLHCERYAARRPDSSSCELLPHRSM
jgi:hypothetical protein